MRKLSDQEVASHLGALPEWRIEKGELTRTFTFKDFPAALAFVNRVGEQAEAAGHHPDIDICYNKVRLGLVTHDAGAPSDRSSSLGWEADRLEATAVARFAINKTVMRIAPHRLVPGGIPEALADTLLRVPAPAGAEAWALVCRNRTCLPPIIDAEALLEALGPAV